MNRQIQLVLSILEVKHDSVSISIAGDFGLDVFVHGSVNRISPEAPVPVLLKEREEIRLGLAGNVIENLWALREQFPSNLLSFGVHGPDEMGDILGQKVSELSGSYLIQDHQRKTTVKTRYMSGNHQLLRMDDEDTKEMYGPVSWALFKSNAEDGEVDVLILQDYAKGFLTKENITEFINIANEKNVLIISDPNVNSDPYNYARSTIITPNLQEAKKMLSKMGVLEYNDDYIIASILKRELDLKMVLITKGSNGMLLLDENNEYYDFPALAKNTVDVTGAGDTIVASLALGLANGYSIVESCWLATGAASVVVQKQGTSTATIEEIKRELQNV